MGEHKHEKVTLVKVTADGGPAACKLSLKYTHSAQMHAYMLQLYNTV
eukprot:COSAG05_NODE_14654_length_391_cov_0.702055_1_plen_46_part_10